MFKLPIALDMIGRPFLCASAFKPDFRDRCRSSWGQLHEGVSIVPASDESGAETRVIIMTWILRPILSVFSYNKRGSNE